MWLVTQLTKKVVYLEIVLLTMLIAKWAKVTRNKSAFNSITISYVAADTKKDDSDASVGGKAAQTYRIPQTFREESNDSDYMDNEH